MAKFYESWPELKRNPLYVGGVSYGGLYAPRLAYAIHSSLKDVNLRGVINANGILDYRYDPHVTTTENLLYYGLIPLSLQEEYERNKCHVEWIWFYYISYTKPPPPAPCFDLFIKAWMLIGLSNQKDLLRFFEEPITPAHTVPDLRDFVGAKLRPLQERLLQEVNYFDRP